MGGWGGGGRYDPLLAFLGRVSGLHIRFIPLLVIEACYGF